jgi:hypothetical protein
MADGSPGLARADRLVPTPSPDSVDRLGARSCVALGYWSRAANGSESAPDWDYLPISADWGKRAGYGLDFLLPRPPGDNG